MAFVKLSTYNESIQLFGPLPIPGGGSSGAIPVLAATGTPFLEGVMVVPVSSHRKTLPSRTAKAMESRQCPTLLRELFHPQHYTRRELTLYALLADQTATVLVDNTASNFLHFLQIGILEKFRFSAEPF